MATNKDTVYKQNTHRKLSRQGTGMGTKTGRKKGTLKRYRGQGCGRKSVKH